MSGKKGYKVLNHVSDELIQAYGPTLEAAFESAGIALVNTMVNTKKVNKNIEDFIETIGWDLKNLLYNWLEELLIKITSDRKIYSSFNIKILKNKEGYKLTARAFGEELDIKKHKPKTEVKAITYHMMEIKNNSDQVTIQFLLDL